MFHKQNCINTIRIYMINLKWFLQEPIFTKYCNFKNKSNVFMVTLLQIDLSVIYEQNLTSLKILFRLWSRNIFLSTCNWDISLKIGHIMIFSMRSSKMEFANHFAKINAIDFLQISLNGCNISENVSLTVLSSFLCWLIIHHQKNELRTVYLSFLEI